MLHAPTRMLDKDATYWFPMRVTYGRQIKTKAFLDSLNIENFMPMTTKTIKQDNRIRHKSVPAISNLIFVRHTMNHLNHMKRTMEEAAPLRYMTRQSVETKDAPLEILTVPDKQMESFIKVASASDDERTYLKPDELTGKTNGKVLIISGPFKGVEGTIKRVHGNKRVVVELESLGGVCINFVPKSTMMEIE